MDKCKLCGIRDYELIKKNGIFEKIKMKNGKIKEYLNYDERVINRYKCLLENKSLFIEHSIDQNKKIQKNVLTNFNEANNKDEIIEIFKKLKKLKYSISYYKELYIYKSKNVSSIATYIYLKNKFLNNKNLELIEKLGIVYKSTKIRYPKLDTKKILIQLFFSNYIQSLIEEIELRYGKNITLEFKNFNEIYNYLNEKGYVKKYNKEIIPQINDYLKTLDKLLIKDKSKIDKIKNELIKKERIIYVI